MPSRRTTSLRRVLASLCTLAATGGVLAAIAGPAQAAAPTGLAPATTVNTLTPTMSWGRVAGATSYEVQADDNSDFTSLLLDVGTVNNRYAWTQTYPTGRIYWRVRAATPSGTTTWSTTSFLVSPTAPPSALAPISGQHLTQPAQPALLTWTPVTGAVHYHVQVDTDGDGLALSYDQEIDPPRFQVPDPQKTQQWFWRVQTDYGNGRYSQWGDWQTYYVDPLPDVTYNAATPAGTSQGQVELKWDPVAGATSYQLQVGENEQMTNVFDDVIVKGTRYSPDTRYPNNQFYWRVRPIDAAGNRPVWPSGSPQVYDLKYLEAATLLYPADQVSPAVGTDFYYQWTPVPRASSYQLQLSTDRTFTAGVSACTSFSTTFVPDGGACMPNGQGTQYYWRVIAYDSPGNTPSLASKVRTFTYQADRVQLLSPAPGASVSVPQLSWQPQEDANTYVVHVYRNGNEVASESTTSTSWVSPSTLADGTYSWTVQAVSSTGSATPLYLGGERSFTLTNSVVAGPSPMTQRSGRSTDAPTRRSPLLTWDPVDSPPDQANPGAYIPVYYTIDAKTAGNTVLLNPGMSNLLNRRWSYPAAVATDTYFLSPGSWDWRVTAWRSDTNAPIQSSGWQTFTVANLDPVTGQRLALDGMALDAGTACANALGVPETTSDICTGVPSTPVLDWDPVTDASSYRVYLYNDRELTNPVNGTSYLTTNQTRMTLPWALRDNTADHSYYWYVLPCKVSVCNDDPTKQLNAATNAFRKLSPTPELQGPGRAYSAADTSAPPAVTEANLRFQWKDYLDTNLATPAYYGGATPSYQSGQLYRLQVSTSPTNWDTLLLDRTVDESWLNSWTANLPEGVLYWRVAAIDGTGNLLRWSDPWVFTKSSGLVQLLKPADNSTADNGFYFSWSPTTFAGGNDTHTPIGAYHLQIFRGNDATHSPANAVLDTWTTLSSYAWGRFLPPSGTPYLWRVQWRELDGQLGPWSADGHFTVKSGAVSLLTPTTGLQPTTGLYFTWQPFGYAASYRLEARLAGGPVTYAVSTASTAWAPTDPWGDGSWQWRVVAVDGSGNDIASSAWRGFIVDATVPRVASYKPTTPMKISGNITIVFSEPVNGANATTIKLYRVGARKALGAAVTLDRTHRIATLNPSALLKHHLTYEVRLSTAITDVARNHLVATAFQVATR